MRAVGLILLLAAGAGRETTVVYVVSPLSRLEVETTRSGLFSFVGHDHVVRAHGVTGRVTYDSDDPARSTVEIVTPAESLEVLTPPDTAERRKVTEAMRTDVLDVAHYPAIRFVSRAVQVVPGGVRVTGDFTLVGATRSVTVDMHLQMAADTLRATGSFSVRQSAFDVQPYHGGPGGLVHVADRVTFRLEVVALRNGAP
jgi:polyisoprenoid-binding protein YceI